MPGFGGVPKERDHVEEIGVEENTILKLFAIRRKGRHVLDSFC